MTFVQGPITLKYLGTEVSNIAIPQRNTPKCCQMSRKKKFFLLYFLFSFGSLSSPIAVQEAILIYKLQMAVALLMLPISMFQLLTSVF